MMKLGSKGDEVKNLQIKLGLKPDGNFGLVTEKAVKDWQTKNGLVVDGIVGKVTLEKLGLVNSDMTMIDKLKGHIPDNIISQIPDLIEKYGATTPLRLSHFLSQCAHESGNFKSVRENTNYSEKRMLEIFKSDFDVNKDKVISESEKLKAKSLVGKPDAIADFVYANQNGNGNESSKDGSKFKGRGYIQLTGRANYSKFSQFIGEDCVGNPELVSTKYPLASAAFFFNKNGLWEICDIGFSDSIVRRLTIRINGGTNGLNDRIEKFNKFYNLLK